MVKAEISIASLIKSKSRQSAKSAPPSRASSSIRQSASTRTMTHRARISMISIAREAIPRDEPCWPKLLTNAYRSMDERESMAARPRTASSTGSDWTCGISPVYQKPSSSTSTNWPNGHSPSKHRQNSLLQTESMRIGDFLRRQRELVAS